MVLAKNCFVAACSDPWLGGRDLVERWMAREGTHCLPYASEQNGKGLGPTVPLKGMLLPPPGDLKTSHKAKL